MDPEMKDMPVETDAQKMKVMMKMMRSKENKASMKLWESHEDEDEVFDEGEMTAFGELPATTQKFVVETEELRQRSIKELRHLIGTNHPIENEADDVPVGHASDSLLLRMLRGKKFDVERSYRLLKAHEAGKIKYNLQHVNVLKLRPLLELGYLQVPPGARDKRGRQLFFMDPSRMNFAVAEANIDQLVPLYWYIIERAMGETKTQQRGVCMVMNMGRGWHFPPMSFMYRMQTEVKAVTQDIMLNRSGVRLGESIMLSPPWWMRAMMSVAQLMMSQKLRDRMKYFKEDEMDSLFDYVDPACVPSHIHPRGTLSYDHAATVQQMMDEYQAQHGQ